MTTTRLGQMTPIGHSGRCGRRVQCWRADCRLKFGDYRTVEITARVAVACCHRPIVALDDPRLASVAA